MCELLLKHNGRPKSPLIRQKYEMVRKCLMSDCYFPLWSIQVIVHVCLSELLTESYTPSAFKFNLREAVTVY